MNAISTQHKSVQIDNLDIFYRESGPTDAPSILLLHGFPTSSHMFRNLIPTLDDKFHLVAPDYPGFGASSMPRLDAFEYSFDKLADVIEKFVDRVGLQEYFIYLMDYGAPIGYRLASQRPERVLGLIVQNGNAYDEGLRDFWIPIKNYWKEKNVENAKVLEDNILTLDATKWQYTNGVRNPEAIAPDNWFHDQYLLDRPGNKEIQLELFYSYGTNPPLYPQWQEYFRVHQPPTLLVWGKGDYIFPEEGAHPYKRDLNNIEFHILNTGHFALEEDLEFISARIRDFVQRNTSR
jgi:pimeloyl-ACP methyl ester carboxylesterase